MQKAIAYILIITVLLQSFNVEFNDYYKIPALASHFITHLEKGDSISEFISMHYGSLENSHKEDHKEHQNLPFQHHQLDSTFQFNFIIVTNYIEFKYNDIVITVSNFFYKNSFKSLFRKFIFQPPQK
ncbi:hypothetical protein [Lutibacter sp.]|uniref:hypothetical protein n=1 Tax=Lutibacter sp. TaxID=1925666 RepID=UPI002732D473|nr:hypothetical protein [Lutibacter sp.]MDP3311897.1 hypothetical protein [Lutibacter sp.]